MNNNNLINPDGSVRRFVHRQPPPPPPPPIPNFQNHFPPNYQYPHPNHNYGYVAPVGSIRMPGTPLSMPRGDFSHNNVVIHQSVQQHVTMDGCMQRGSYRHGVMQMPNPPPQTFTPHPPPLPSPNTESLRAILPASCEQEHEQNGIPKMNDDMKGKTIDEFGAEVCNKYRTLGQNIAYLITALKRSNKVEVTLRAQIGVQNGQISELNGEVETLKNDIEKIKEKAEKEVREAKSEESIWRNKFVELNEQLETAKSESVADKNTIKSLEGKVTSFEANVKNLEGKVVKFETSEKVLKKRVEDKDTEIKKLQTKVNENEITIKQKDGKLVELETSKKKNNELLEAEKKSFQLLDTNYKKLGEEFNKMNQCFLKSDEKNKNLKSKNDELFKKDKENNATIESLKSEKTSLKQSVDEKEATILKKSQEFSNISQKLEKERKEKQGVVVELENKNKRITELKAEKESLVNEMDEFKTTTFNMIVEQLKAQFFPVEVTKGLSLSSSHSYEKDASPEPSSSSSSLQDGKVNTGDNEVQQLESHKDVPQTATLGKKIISATKRSSTGISKKMGASTNQNQPSTMVINLPRIFQKSKSKDGEAGPPEVSSSSRASSSPSPSKRGRPTKQK